MSKNLNTDINNRKKFERNENMGNLGFIIYFRGHYIGRQSS